METIILNGKEYQLDIEQAKKLNLLKEKDGRVRSWREFTKKYDKAYIVNETSAFPIDANVFCTSSQLTIYEAKALAAFSKLLKLRRDWIGEWEPNWQDSSPKYVINIWKHQIGVEIELDADTALSFPTEQMAGDFLETFRDLIEEAKILI